MTNRIEDTHCDRFCGEIFVFFHTVLLQLALRKIFYKNHSSAETRTRCRFASGETKHRSQRTQAKREQFQCNSYVFFVSAVICASLVSNPIDLLNVSINLRIAYAFCVFHTFGRHLYLLLCIIICFNFISFCIQSYRSFCLRQGETECKRDLFGVIWRFS